MRHGAGPPPGRVRSLLPRAPSPHRGTVLQEQASRRNPDASRAPSSAVDTPSGAARGCAAPEGFAGSGVQPPASTPGAGLRNTPPSSRGCPGRSRCRSVPDGDSGHTGTGGGCPGLRPPTPKGWTRPPPRARLAPGIHQHALPRVGDPDGGPARLGWASTFFRAPRVLPLKRPSRRGRTRPHGRLPLPGRRRGASGASAYGSGPAGPR